MHIAFLTTEYPILGMKCGGIGIFFNICLILSLRVRLV